MIRTLSTAVATAALLSALPASADEGMWTFDNFPRALVKERYGADIDAAWLERVRLSTVRLAGCTASFVSGEGLILTNHHCADGCLAQYSTRERSLIDSGFYAERRGDELSCGGQIAEVLTELEDVTAAVNAATAGLAERPAQERRRQTLTTLEQKCEDTSRRSRNPLKCQAVTLYGGDQYWLYKYQRYTDVRLVFAPEAAIAAFGGDPDNFQFPRWCLDMAVLRAYVDGKPAATPHHFTIDFAGPREGDLVLVAGHPGSTDRQLTVAQLKTLRDIELPPALLRRAELRGRYIQLAESSESAERIVHDPLSNLENGLKVERKLLDALLDDDLLVAKHDAEAELRMKVTSDPALRALGDPWARIEEAEKAGASFALPYTFLERSAGFNGALFRYARTLVRGAAERQKPNRDRLREFTDAALPRIEQQLAAPIPVYPELERLTLGFSLARMREWLGPDHPVVRRLLATDSPESLAAATVDGSMLADPAKRLELWKGGQAAIDRSADPMIELARSVDADARALRTRHEQEVEAPEEAAGEAIAKARFAAFGTSVYPDATFTLRLNFGTVKGWVENGEPVAPFTRLERLYERATGRAPFAVPERWLEARAALDPATPFNLSTDNDIVGGNSGSPLLNARGDIVGLVFDGNIHSISGAYWFDAEKNRTVAVDAAIIRLALAQVYRADALLEEMGGSR
jgi:hypothetical protein